MSNMLKEVIFSVKTYTEKQCHANSGIGTSKNEREDNKSNEARSRSKMGPIWAGYQEGSCKTLWHIPQISLRIIFSKSLTVPEF